MNRRLIVIFALCMVLAVAVAHAGTLNLPEGITVIEAETFRGDISLDEVIIPEGVTKIGEYAFWGCDLSYVVLPSTLTEIADNAFDYSLDLTFETTKNTYAYYWVLHHTIPESWFETELNEDNTCSITHYLGPEECRSDLLLPETIKGVEVSAIAGYAFYYNSKLTGELVLPNGVEEIGTYAFVGCGFTGDLYLPASLGRVGRYAFSSCSGLTGITIAGELNAWGDGTFQECEKLESVDVSGENETIPDYTFFGCIRLKTVTLGKGITRIGPDAFGGCRSLEEIELPEGLATIESGAFAECSALKKVTVPASVTAINEHAFDGCDQLTLYVTENSYAKQFAEDNNIPFVVIEPAAE